MTFRMWAGVEGWALGCGVRALGLEPFSKTGVYAGGPKDT